MFSLEQFKKIDFGHSSAQAEARENPELLTKGFLDGHNIANKISNGRQWLILGYKGSGKSAIAEHLRLINEEDPLSFINIVNVEDFEYIRFTEMAKSSEALQTALPITWAWIIYSYMLNSFFKDNGLKTSNEEHFFQIKESFSKMGLSPVYDLNTIVRISSETNFKLIAPKFAEKSWIQKKDPGELDLRWYINNLKPFISEIRSESKHFLIIDGLDDIFTNKEEQYESITALIYEVARINDFLRKNSSPGKVIVLCRTDIFELLGGANKNKIRQDYSIDLDWNSNPRSPEKSPLVAIGNIRGNVSLENKINVINDFFPKKYERKITLKSILDMTRHTPRDYLRLLSYLQEHATSVPMHPDDISNAMRQYSSKYFLPEIHDELHGYASLQEIKGIMLAIESISKRDFSFDEILQSSKSSSTEIGLIDLEKLLMALYECSAIGNVRIHKKFQGKRFLSFKYRNRTSSFKKDERIILHRGLWKAFNIQWEPFSRDIDPDVSNDEA